MKNAIPDEMMIDEIHERSETLKVVWQFVLLSNSESRQRTDGDEAARWGVMCVFIDALSREQRLNHRRKHPQPIAMPVFSAAAEKAAALPLPSGLLISVTVNRMDAENDREESETFTFGQ